MIAAALVMGLIFGMPNATALALKLARSLAAFTTPNRRKSGE
jgi:hypothetical protein